MRPMIFLQPQQAIGASSPLLEIFVSDQDGRLFDVHAAEFQIWTIGASATQVYPASAGNWQAATRLSVGRYTATWTAPAPGDGVVGRREIRWRWQRTSTSALEEGRQTFEIVGWARISRGYCGVQDMRDEGLAAGGADEARCLAAIQRATALIERATGVLWFYPKPLQMVLDGPSTSVLRLPEPLLAIEDVRDRSSDGTFTSATPFSASEIAIYARPWEPAERAAGSRLERVYGGAAYSDTYGSSARWGRGRQRYQVRGVFGIAEPIDAAGLVLGDTPFLIRQAAVRLALAGAEGQVFGAGSGASGPVKRERTRDQEIEYFQGTATSVGVTSDAEVNEIIAMYRRALRSAVVA